MKEQLKNLQETATKIICSASSIDELEALRIQYLGKKGELTSILKQMGKLSAEERPQMGQLANQLRSSLEKLLEEKNEELSKALLEMKLQEESVDVTIPGKKVAIGHKHPMYNVLDQIKDIFIGMGFDILDDQEIEFSEYNFTKLNTPDGHPAREWSDTFYLTEDSSILLRTQTSNMQIRAMEEKELPIRILAPGRVYRKDEVDATHSPMFHQIEGMVIDKGVTMGDLKATLNLVVQQIYGEGTVTRFRPHHFPFTEPSCEMDIQCMLMGHDGWDSDQLAEEAQGALDGCQYVSRIGFAMPEANDFADKIVEKYGGTKETECLFGRDGVYWIVDAINRAGSADPTAIRDALEATEVYEGLIGQLVMNAETHNPVMACEVFEFSTTADGAHVKLPVKTVEAVVD